MPTAAKLVAAVFFAVFGFFCGDLVKPLLPEGTRTGLLNETLAGLGLLFGWTMAGARAGEGGAKAGIGYGLTTVALIAFWGVVIFAGVEMIEMSLDRRYRGPMQAIKSMFKIAVDYFKLIGTTDIVIAAVVGGAFGGWLANWAAKRWS